MEAVFLCCVLLISKKEAVCICHQRLNQRRGLGNDKVLLLRNSESSCGSPMNACWMDRPLLNVSSRKQASIDSGTCRRTHVSFPVSLPVRISCPLVPAAAGIQVRAFPPTPCWPHHITPRNPARHCFISLPKVLILLIRF